MQIEVHTVAALEQDGFQKKLEANYSSVNHLPIFQIYLQVKWYRCKRTFKAVFQ